MGWRTTLSDTYLICFLIVKPLTKKVNSRNLHRRHFNSDPLIVTHHHILMLTCVCSVWDKSLVSNIRQTINSFISSWCHHTKTTPTNIYLSTGRQYHRDVKTWSFGMSGLDILLKLSIFAEASKKEPPIGLYCNQPCTVDNGDGAPWSRRTILSTILSLTSTMDFAISSNIYLISVHPTMYVAGLSRLQTAVWSFIYHMFF